MERQLPGGGACRLDRVPWVSIVTEDWRWRMRVPPKGDYASLPLTAAAIKVANAWDPAKDVAAGEQCRAYRAAAIMRVPGRVRISWDNDSTLKVETEAGTRHVSSCSVRWWVNHRRRNGRALRRELAGCRRWTARRGSVTWGITARRDDHMRPGYLRRNGVPYSANARVTGLQSHVRVKW